MATLDSGCKRRLAFGDTMTTDTKMLAAQAHELKAQGRLREAIGLYRQAAILAPGSAAAAHNLAAALGDAGEWSEAERHIRRAVSGGGAAESWLVLARCLQSRGALDAAEDAFAEALRRSPVLYDAHVDLAQLQWMRTGEALSVTAVVDKAIAQSPSDLRPRLARLKILANTERGAEAAAEADALAHASNDDLALLVTASQLAAEHGDPRAALAHAERAVRIAPEHPVVTIALIIAALGVGDAARAETLALAYLARMPDDQLALALLSTAWRLRGDARYHALFDYDAYVRPGLLDTPAGWSSLESYVDELREALAESHHLHTHPFGQSVRHGTQRSDILAIAHPAIAALPRALAGPIARYLKTLPGRPGPLARRLQGGYGFQGMWSIRMQAGGYHLDHVHPNGWISSAGYVETPDDLSGQEGWLRFGAPGVRTEPVLHAEHYVAPKPGMVVLFPSYMWHGVTPYTAPGARMSFAFDLEPAPTPQA